MNGYIDFLIRAKRACYAGKGAETASSRPKSHDLTYSEDALMYYDTYLGEKEFAGEEAIWDGGTPKWSMNYVGRVLNDAFSGDFLKHALYAVPRDMPFRGPTLFCEDGNEYRCEVTGGFDWFQGYEQIWQDGVLTYDCCFHGGRVTSAH